MIIHFQKKKVKILETSVDSLVPINMFFKGYSDHKFTKIDFFKFYFLKVYIEEYSSQSHCALVAY